MKRFMLWSNFTPGPFFNIIIVLTYTTNKEKYQTLPIVIKTEPQHINCSEGRSRQNFLPDRFL